MSSRRPMPNAAQLEAIKPHVDRFSEIGGIVLIDQEKVMVAIALSPERARLLTEDEWPQVLEDTAVMRAFFRRVGLKVQP